MSDSPGAFVTAPVCADSKKGEIKIKIIAAVFRMVSLGGNFIVCSECRKHCGILFAFIEDVSAPRFLPARICA